MKRSATSGPEPFPREEAEAQFAQLYADHGRALMLYALRRTREPEDAADVVGETFLAAWRRADEMPPGSEVRLWLYGIARGLIANHERGDRRRTRLAERLRAERSTKTCVEPAPDAETGAVGALRRLSKKDREVLMLAGWEGLEPVEIARVLRISQVAARGRLHRARRRFERELVAAESSEAPWCVTELELEEAR